jgi:hypothetical protein
MQWLYNMFWICDTCPSTNDRRLFVFYQVGMTMSTFYRVSDEFFLMGMKMLCSCLQTHLLVKCVCTRVYVYVCVYIIHIHICIRKYVYAGNRYGCGFNIKPRDAGL